MPRNGGPPPKGVTARNETLIFGRPLTLEDAGRYHCIAQNSVGKGKADVEVTVSGRWAVQPSHAHALSRVSATPFDRPPYSVRCLSESLFILSSYFPDLRVHACLKSAFKSSSTGMLNDSGV